MKKFAVVVCLFLLTAALGLAQSTTRITEMRTSRNVDPKLQSPIDVSETFLPEALPIFISGKLLDAPVGTQVKIVVYYLQNGEQQIAVHEFPDISGTGYFSFRLNPPASGWFLGKFKAAFYLNGKEQGSIGFAVVPAKATPGHPEYRTFSSREHGFSIQYPAGWVEGQRTSSSVACMFLANAANSPVASLNVQVVPVTLANPSQFKEAINLVAQQLIDQITKNFQGRVRKDSWATADGKEGRELDSEYPYRGTSIRQRQFLTYYSGTVFVVIYTSDEKVYDSYVGHYLKAIKSLSFSGK